MNEPMPQSQQIEREILASCLYDPDCLPIVRDVLSPDDFYSTAHRKIYSACLRAHADSGVCDLISVCEALKVAGDLAEVGGYSFVAGLEAQGLLPNYEYYADKIRTAAVLRQTIRLSQDVQRQCLESGDDAGTILHRYYREISELEGRLHGKSTFVSMRRLSEEMFEIYEKLYNSSGSVTGVPTGYYTLDEITAGWQPTDLIILAGRPSMGKTAMALNLMRQHARHGWSSALFSLEQGSRQLYSRILSAISQVNGHKFRGGRFNAEDWRSIVTAQGQIAGWPIWIDDTAGLHYAEIRRRARKLWKQHAIKVFYIDYLGLVQGDRQGGRVQEIGTITRNLKALAKELEVPIVLLSQLNRKLEERDDKRPKLADLRDSGEIEQDADVVGFLYRPVVYDDKHDPTEAELIIAKQRNGPTGRVKLRWFERTMRFENAEAGEVP